MTLGPRRSSTRPEVSNFDEEVQRKVPRRLPTSESLRLWLSFPGYVPRLKGGSETEVSYRDTPSTPRAGGRGRVSALQRRIPRQKGCQP